MRSAVLLKVLWKEEVWEEFFVAGCYRISIFLPKKLETFFSI